MDITRIVKEIGRGKNHARDLDQLTACQLYQAMLDDQLDPLILGAVLIALRIKGESEGEMLGFWQALQEKLPKLQVPEHQPMPIVIPSYNGARRQGNLTPLLALLLEKVGFPVFVHGVDYDPTRVTTEAVLAELQIFPVSSMAEAQQRLNQGKMVFVTVSQWCPPLARQLALRWQLGLRNSAHTLAKLATPFPDSAALRLSAVSHPEYIPKVATFFQQTRSPALLLNGCEGEVYANPQRGPALYWINSQLNQPEQLTERLPEQPVDLPPSKTAEDTARWIKAVLERNIPVPRALRLQIACCLIATGRSKTVEQGLAVLESHGY